MLDDNVFNIQYFESSSMCELYKTMEHWQNEYRKRFFSLSVQKDGDNFCCIALTNYMGVWVDGPRPLEVCFPREYDVTVSD